MGRFLQASDPTIRRWSSVVYCVATGAAVLAWAAWGGLDAIEEGRILAAAWLIGIAAIVWFVVAGIGLRLVRAAARRRHDLTGQPLD